jgi:hypothetical protein
MERPAKSTSEQTHGRPAAERASEPTSTQAFADNRDEAIAQRKLADTIHNSPSMLAQRKLIEAIDNSPRMLAQRMLAQRRQLRSMFGETAQLESGPQEDELLQGKFEPVQRQERPEEQLVQGRSMQMKGGVGVNDEAGLEREVDVMGGRTVEPAAQLAGGPRKTVGSVSTISDELQFKAQAAQLKKVKMEVTGLTHLVYPLSGKEIGKSGDQLISEKVDFLHNEGAEVSEPSMMWIETDLPLLSRRGPNQEAFHGEDVDGPAHYVWYPTRGTGQRPDQNNGPFIREDTLKVPDNQVPGKGNKFTAKTDVNVLRIAAETLISDHYPVPMTKSSLRAVFLDDDKAYRVYATRVALAQVGQDADQDSEDFQRLVSGIANTNALTELGEVHINRGKVGSDGLGTVIHELMHFYGMQTSFIGDVCGGRSDGFNEGVTEYFAQKVTSSVGILRSRVYATEVRQTSEIVGLVTEDLLLRAYFRGETNALINALKRVKRWDNEKNCVLPKSE